MKTKAVSFFLVVVLLILVAGVSSAITAWILTARSESVPADYHAWIHKELGLTAGQEQRLAPSERRYEEAKRHLTEVIRIANQELAVAISEDRTNSPRVQEAVETIHGAMGELQEATLQHIFEMKEVLEPAQYEHLIQLTEEALRGQSSTK